VKKKGQHVPMKEGEGKKTSTVVLGHGGLKKKESRLVFFIGDTFCAKKKKPLVKWWVPGGNGETCRAHPHVGKTPKSLKKRWVLQGGKAGQQVTQENSRTTTKPFEKKPLGEKTIHAN